MNIYIRIDLFKYDFPLNLKNRDVNQKCKWNRPHIPLLCLAPESSQAPGGIPGPKMCDRKYAQEKARKCRSTASSHPVEKGLRVYHYTAHKLEACTWLSQRESDVLL